MTLEIGAVGSPADVATFILVGILGLRYHPRVKTMSAALVALAEGRPDVDHERIMADLEVEARDVDAVRPTVTDGGGEGS